jgi:hypothetical protein
LEPGHYPLHQLVLDVVEARRGGARTFTGVMPLVRRLESPRDLLDRELVDVEEHLDGDDELLVPRSSDSEVLGNNLRFRLWIAEKRQPLHKIRQAQGKILERLTITECDLLVFHTEALRCRLAHPIIADAHCPDRLPACVADGLVTMVGTIPWGTPEQIASSAERSSWKSTSSSSIASQR